MGPFVFLGKHSLTSALKAFFQRRISGSSHDISRAFIVTILKSSGDKRWLLIEDICRPSQLKRWAPSRQPS
jgi:hypothetical protein